MTQAKMNNSTRIVFGSGPAANRPLLPEVLEVGWLRFQQADTGHLRPHLHPGAFELCFILDGEVEWETAGSSDILRAGDVFLTQPDETHWGLDTALHPCSLYWLIVGSPGSGSDWPGLDDELVLHLDARLRQIKAHRLGRAPHLESLFATVLREHQRVEGAHTDRLLQVARARTALHALLLEIVSLTERECARGYSVDTDRAIELLRENAHDPDAVQRVCELMRTEYKLLNEAFLADVGSSLSQYWLRERIRLARQRLATPAASVTEVANDLGFSSSQHFATAFRKITGLTPSRFRRVNAGGT